MRYGFLTAAAILWAGAAGAQTITPVSALPLDRQVLPVHIGGRVVAHPLPGGGTEYEHQWPGVYFESRFDGTKVYLAFNDPLNEYRLLIDDRPPLTLNQPGKGQFEIGGLPEGPHSVRLEKVTESQATSGAFDGFSIPADEKALPVSGRARQMEFIGDSSMTGYGDRSTTQQCTDEERRARTDTQQGFAALTARHFDADYQINAISGRGLIRNYGGFSPDDAMSLVYPYTLADKTVPYNDPAWQPQIIFVKLDADFAKPLTAGEPWSTMQDLVASYRKAQLAFATMLHQRYPSAALLIWAPSAKDMQDPKVAAHEQAIEKVYSDAVHKIGIRQIGFVPTPSEPPESTACDYHGSLNDLKRLAAAAETYIEARPELWGDTSR